MPVIICLLRGINIGGHHKIKMDVLRNLFESLGYQDVQTHLQSGNVIFRTRDRSLAQIHNRIQTAIEYEAGFRPDVLLRTVPELHRAIDDSPFANRPGLDPSKLAVTFFAEEPGKLARENALKIRMNPEEMHIFGRHMYIYFPNGMARPSFSWSVLERTLKTPSTSRNWNTATKLLQLAVTLESPA